MDLLDYSVFFGSGVACLVLGILLLFIRVAVGDVHPYRRAKKFLGLCAIINFIVNASIIALMAVGIDYRLLDGFFVPAVYYTQLYLMCFSLLAIYHSRRLTRRVRIIFQLPVVVITLAYAGCYLATNGLAVTSLRYAQFMEGMPARAITLVLYVALVATVVVCLHWMIGEARAYRRHIENFFSDEQFTDGMWTYRISYVYVGYVVMTMLGVFLPGDYLHVVFMAVNTLFMVLAVIVMINLHHTFFRTIPAVAVEERGDDGAESQEAEPKGEGEEMRSVETIVEQWTKRTPLPYMRGGVTLAMVAEEMGLSVGVLSFHINRYYGDNFNAWINRLRVEEIKRVLDGDKTVALADLAERAGFTDASAMGKVFKKIVGITPSAYRSQGGQS